MLTFDPVAHVYYWHGKPVPNVTRVIGHLTDYSRIPPAVLANAQREGLAVHKMVELDARGTLDVEHLLADEATAWLRGPYQAWCRFKEESGIDIWCAEQPLYHPRKGYAGTPDVIGLVPKLKKVRGPANIDVKRSLYAGPAIGLQTAGYTQAWNETDGKRDLRVPPSNRFALELRKDGTYRFTQFSEADDFDAFNACLQQHRWREKHYGPQ